MAAYLIFVVISKSTLPVNMVFLSQNVQSQRNFALSCSTNVRSVSQYSQNISHLQVPKFSTMGRTVVGFGGCGVVVGGVGGVVGRRVVTKTKFQTLK